MLAVVTPTPDVRFQRAYADHVDAISRYCLRRLPVDDARDAVAETFSVAWRRIESMPDHEGTLPWLYGVARNVVRNVERSSRRTVRLRSKIASQPHTDSASAEAIVVRRAEDQAVVDAIDALRPADREVLRLRGYEGLTTGEVAVVLGISAAAAKKRSARAMQRLRRSLGQNPEFGEGAGE